MKNLRICALLSAMIIIITGFASCKSDESKPSYVKGEIIITTSSPLLWNSHTGVVEGLILPEGAKVIGCADYVFHDQKSELVKDLRYYGSQFLVKLPTENKEDYYGTLMLSENSVIKYYGFNLIVNLNHSNVSVSDDSTEISTRGWDFVHDRPMGDPHVGSTATDSAYIMQIGIHAIPPADDYEYYNRMRTYYSKRDAQ